MVRGEAEVARQDTKKRHLGVEAGDVSRVQR